jgi:hypothetical protein
MMPLEDRPWWMPLELLERNRFRVLQQLYDLAGGATDQPLTLDAPAIAATLGISEADVAQAVAFLIHAHYASEAEAGGDVCVTRRAVYYLEAGAYQRRTIRD